MIGDFIYLTLSILSIISYCEKKYTLFIVIYTSIISNCWGLITKGSIGLYDWVFVITIVTCVAGRYRSKNFFDIRKDNIGGLILVLITYSTIAAIISPFRGVGSLGYCIMTARMELFYLIYFVFRAIPYSRIMESIKVIFKLSFITGILYYLQFIGINLLIFGNADDNITDGYTRYSNIPAFTIPIFAYFFTASNIRHRICGITMWGGIILLSQTRGLIIGLAASIFIYLRKSWRNIKKSVIITMVILCISASGLLAYRFSSEGSTGSGMIEELPEFISLVESGEYKTLNSTNAMWEKGTFVFRLLMIFEKCEYLAQRPFSLLFGAGSYHERSPQTKMLPFVFGSNSELGRSKVDTDDVMLISRFFRYGLVYITIFAMFLYRCYKNNNRGDTEESRIFKIIWWVYLIGGIAGNYYSNIPQMSIFFLFLVFSLKHKYQQNSNHLLKH